MRSRRIPWDVFWRRQVDAFLSSLYSASVFDSLNVYGKRRIPFLFVIDFALEHGEVIPLHKCASRRVLFDVDGKKNHTVAAFCGRKISFSKEPVPYSLYKRAFDQVQEELRRGNSYLLNLTFPMDISVNLSLKEIFYRSTAKFKLFYRDRFVVFSPERFVTISDSSITTFPMKGTIDASVPNARENILADEKETAEHITVVDLLRNDLGMVAGEVRVKRLRYVDEVRTHERTLLQVSSEISGRLPRNWNERIGDILLPLLPAGSVTGAPKKKTVEIIRRVENYRRGFYTGVFGVFDGQMLDSAVMIRFIQKGERSALTYKSGGGITIYSDPESEYREMMDKVYVPIG